MTTDTTPVVPLPVHPWPLSPERLALLRDAKAAIDAQYGLEVRIVPVEAIPGSPGRTLCFGSPPPFVTEAVVIRAENAEAPESVRGALQFVLRAPEGAPATYSEADMLSMFLGVRVRELVDPFELGNAEHDWEMQKAAHR